MAIAEGFRLHERNKVSINGTGVWTLGVMVDAGGSEPQNSGFEPDAFLL